MTIKIIGLCLVIAAGALLGNYKAKSLTVHKQTLQDISLLLKQLSDNIIYKRVPVMQAIQNIMQTGSFLQIMLKQPKQETKSYEEFLQKVFPKDELIKLINEKQYNMLQKALTETGQCVSDLESDKLQYYINWFNGEQELAAQQEQKNTKVYRALGLYCGAAVAIFLI